MGRNCWPKQSWRCPWFGLVFVPGERSHGGGGGGGGGDPTECRLTERGGIFRSPRESALAAPGVLCASPRFFLQPSPGVCLQLRDRRSICIAVPVHVCPSYTPACACVCSRLLTVMKGLEFAGGEEFIMTLIPLERDSLAWPPTQPPHSRRQIKSVVCDAVCFSNAGKKCAVRTHSSLNFIL